MQHTCHHRVGLVDQLSEGLFFVDGAEDHLMLTLLADIFNRWSIHVVPWSHRRNLDPTVSDTLCRNEFFVKLRWRFRLLKCCDPELLFPEAAVDIEVLCLDNVVLFGLQKILLLLVVDVHLLLHVQRGQCLVA